MGGLLDHGEHILSSLAPLPAAGLCQLAPEPSARRGQLWKWGFTASPGGAVQNHAGHHQHSEGGPGDALQRFGVVLGRSLQVMGGNGWDSGHTGSVLTDLKLCPKS